MAAVKCPNCGEYQSIEIEDLGQGCLGPSALALGFLCSMISRLKGDAGPYVYLGVGFFIGVPIVLVLLLLYLEYIYPFRCEDCGYVSLGAKRRER